MQKPFSGAVEYNACLLDSSSDLGESDAHVLKPLLSDSVDSIASIPNVCFLLAGGEEPMRESESGLGSCIMAPRGRCELWSTIGDLCMLWEAFCNI